MNKYNARKTEVDGKTFDSQKEANRYTELILMQRAGSIKNLQTQKKFCVIPTLEDGKGKVQQRASYYIADFVYYEREGRSDAWVMVVEDVKSPVTKTAAYKLKKKLMRWRYGITIKEV